MKRLFTLSATLFLFVGSVVLQADDFDPVLPPEPQTKYPVTVGTANPAGASVSGAGWYTLGQQVRISCTLKANYKFRYWTLNGDSCSNQQSFYYTVRNEQANFMAYVQYVEPVVPPITPDTVVPEPPFDPSLPDEPTGGKQEFTSRVLLATIPAKAGYFSHASGMSYREDSTVTICAYANENYILDGWYQNDSLISKQECVDITIPIQDVSLVAKYRLVDNPIYRSYLYVKSNLTGACTFNIMSGNQYVEGSKVILSRTTTSVHEWLGWYIGETLISTDSSFVYTTGRNDVTIWAMYREVFNPSLPDDPTGSNTTSVDNRPTVMIEAPFKEGWVFDHWSDGVTTNPRSVLVEDQYKYTPIYVSGTYVTQLRWDMCEGDAYDFREHILTEEGIYRDTLTAVNTGDSILVLSLFVHPTYSFSENIQIIEGDSLLIGQTYYAASGTYQVSYVSQYGCDSIRIINLSVVDTSHYFSLLVLSADSVIGRVTGSGEYIANSMVKITATGFEGYVFDHWSDGNTDNPRYVLVDADSEYTAYFTDNLHMNQINLDSEYKIQNSKLLINTHLYLLHEGVLYNVNGQRIR